MAGRRRVQRVRVHTPPPGVVEAGVPGRPAGGQVGVAEQDHEAPQEAESRAHPASVQREAEGHQAFVLMGAHWEPDGGDDAQDR